LIYSKFLNSHGAIQTHFFHPPQGKETCAPDKIATAIRERLVKDSQLKDYDIKVRSDNSVVTLRGKVSDPKAKSHASDVVRGVPGVRAVRNELGLKG
jgi:hyperosmotically inducible protein